MITFLLIANTIAILSLIFIERKKPEEALLWIAILSLLPVVGLVLYLAFGSTIRIKLRYYLHSSKLRAEYRKILEGRLSEIKQISGYPHERLTKKQKEIVKFNMRYTTSSLMHHTTGKILTNGKDKFKTLFEDFKKAQHHIHVVYYGIHNDEVGHEFVNVLAQAAKRGVIVRVMYDGLGSFLTPRRMFKPLINAGGIVKSIKPLFTHYRNHRKIVVIDGKIGYTGGMNIGKKYIGALPHKTPWRDTQIRLEGEVVYALQYYFLYDWLYANRPEQSGITEENISKCFPLHDLNHITDYDQVQPCQVIGSGVDTDKEVMEMTYLRMIASAKEEIIIQTPYFVPEESLKDALQVAAASGVKVTLMLPKQKSSFFLLPVTNYYISQMIPYGAKIFLYDGYIHAKTITIDDAVTCIGSVNMDVRSMTLDDEICVLFYGKQMREDHMKIIQKDFERCTELDYESFLKRGLFQRAKERVFLLFAPFM